jgi:hypothetical protein
MGEDLQEAYERRKADKAKPRMSFNWKERLTLTISVAAFLLSILTTYVNVIRTSDHIGVIAEVVPGLRWESGNEFKVIGDDLHVTFVNAGGRPAAITRVSLIFYQPENDNAEDDTGCWLAEMSTTQSNVKGEYNAVVMKSNFEPLVVDANRVGLAKMKLLTKDATIKLNSTNSSIQNDDRRVRYFPVNACLSATISAPSTYGIGYKVIRRWVAHKDSKNTGFEVGLRGSSLQSKPIELYRRTGNVFID